MPDSDFPRIAELMSENQPEPITVETLNEWEQQTTDGMIRQRVVSVDENNRVVGYGVVVRQVWNLAGHFFTWIAVDKNKRHQGIGSGLYQTCIDFAVQQGATRLNSEVRDSDAEGQSFAEKRGFYQRRHLFESTLQLADFDESAFGEVIGEVQKSGIRLFSLADNDTVEMRRKIYDINRLTAFNIPGYEAGFPEFEDFLQMLEKARWFRPAGQFMAADGENVIGLSAVGYMEDTNSMYNMMTGVHPDYSGRKIAQALKLMTIQYAKRCGAVYIRTHNDSENAPMLAINRKFGYQPEPGIYFLAKGIA